MPKITPEFASVEQELPGYIGANVRFFRHFRDMNQADLARLVGVAPAYVSQIESCQRWPSLKVCCRLAESLEITLSMLVEERDRPLGHAKAMQMTRQLLYHLGKGRSFTNGR
jgi:transcriptional regulator with XRE-family HTH domain